MGSLFEGPQIRTSAINQSIGKLNSAGGLKPLNLNAGGLKSRLKGNTLSIRSNDERSGLVNSLFDTSLGQADLLAGLRGDVTDAVTGLRASRLAEVEDARKSTLSNLRDNLARRRVLGSSFAQDAETRSDLEYAKEADRVNAESFLQEIDLKNQLINQEFDVRRNAFQTKLGELNLQADLGAKLHSQASSVLQASAQLRAQLAMQSASLQSQLGIAQAELDAQAAAGAGEFIGKIGGSLLGPLGSNVGEKIGALV